MDLFCDNVKNIIHLWNKNENQYKQEEEEKEDQEDQKEEEEYGEDENEVEIKHTTCASLAIYLMDELSKRLKEKAREENIELDGGTWNNLRGTTLAHTVALFFLDIFYEHDDCCKQMELENFFGVVSRIMKSSIYIKKNIGHENNEDN